MLVLESHEAAVGTAEIGDADGVVRAHAQAAVQTGDIAVFRKQHVPALASEVQAGLRNRKCIAGRVPTDDEPQAGHVAVGWAAEALHSISGWLRCFDLLQSEDLLPNAKDVAETQRPRGIGADLEIHAVEGPGVAHK